MKEISSEKLKIGLVELERIVSQQDYDRSKHKLGRILTVIDGSIADPEQRKAVKDLINDIWYGGESPVFYRDNLYNMLYKALSGEDLYDEPEHQKNEAILLNVFEEKLK